MPAPHPPNLPIGVAARLTKGDKGREALHNRRGCIVDQASGESKFFLFRWHRASSWQRHWTDGAILRFRAGGHRPSA
jgi:hypothetical protein